jgi:hypothetical protein
MLVCHPSESPFLVAMYIAHPSSQSDSYESYQKNEQFNHETSPFETDAMPFIPATIQAALAVDYEAQRRGRSAFHALHSQFAQNVAQPVSKNLCRLRLPPLTVASHMVLSRRNGGRQTSARLSSVVSCISN